jgi:hypothetical protein
MAADLYRAAPGRFDHHLSAAFQHPADLLLEMPVKERKRPGLVSIHQDAA